MESNTRYRYLGAICAALVAPGGLGCGADAPSGSGSPSPGGTSTGTGTSQAPETIYRSGSRLRARILDAGEGAVRFVGWTDDKLHEACAFHRADDGKVRCVPEISQGASIAYLDAACTQPVGVRKCGSQASFLAVKSQEEACNPDDTPYSVYRMGASVAAAPTFSKLGNTCLPDGPAGPGVELLAVSQVPAATFASALVTEETRAGGLMVRVLRGEDGSRETVAMRDADRHVDCGAQMDPNGQLRCAPEATAIGSGSFFEDASCTVPLLADISSKPGCPAPLFAASSSGDACGDGGGAIEVGKKVSTADVYQSAAGACSQVAFLPPDWAFYETGAAVEASSLPKLGEQQLGKGRVRVPVYAGTDKRLLVQGRGFIDTERDQPCVVRPFADGELRCVPEDVERFDLYADDACTEPLAAVPVVPGCVKPPPTVGMMGLPPADPSCASVLVVDKMFELGGKWTGPTVYTKSGAQACTGLDPTQLNVDIYNVGSEMDPWMFPNVVEKTE